MPQLDEMQRVFAGIPANERLGLRLVDASDGSAVVAMAADERYRQEAGVVHGGVIGAVADTAAAYALIGGIRPGEQMIGVEYKINFLRSAVPGGEDLIANARVRKRGRTISVCDVDVTQAAEVVATGVFTYVSRQVA